MFATTRLDDPRREALMTRLKSIEGQARGLQRMLEDGRDCQHIIDQFAALRAASHAVTMQALECYALHSLQESANQPDQVDQVVSDLIGAFARLMR